MCEKQNTTKTQDDTDLKTFDPCCDRRLHHSIDVHVTFIAVEGKQRQYFIVKFWSVCQGLLEQRSQRLRCNISAVKLRVLH